MNQTFYCCLFQNISIHNLNWIDFETNIDNLPMPTLLSSSTASKSSRKPRTIKTWDNTGLTSNVLTNTKIMIKNYKGFKMAAQAVAHIMILSERGKEQSNHERFLI